MRKMKIYFIIIFFGFSLFPLSAQVTEAYLQNMYTNYLQEEGYTPIVDKDGDIRFRFEGGTYYIIVDNNDSKYLQIVYLYFWEIESAPELAKANTAISYVNRTTKIAKIYIERDGINVSISAETLLNQPEDFKNHFARLLRCITTARNDFIEEMNK